MMPLHLFLVLCLFKGTNRPDNDFLQVQDTQLPNEVDEMRRSQPFIHQRAGFVQDYMQLIDKSILIGLDKFTLTRSYVCLKKQGYLVRP